MFSQTTASAQESIPSRIVSDLRERIIDGTLAPGDRLPSTRLYAQQQGISRGSVVSAYEQLVGEGYVLSSPGGSFVNPRLPQSPEVSPPNVEQVSTPRLRADLRPGVPETGQLLSREWRRAWRMAAQAPAAYPVPGSRRLRELLAEHLRVTRSMAIDPDSVMITLGARDGLRMLVLAAGESINTVGVEDPGFPNLHAIPESLGRHIIRVAVDEEGIDINELYRLNPSMVLVMPNHQYPVGSMMSAQRRWELIEWAKKTGGIIVEDDYDSELRTTHPALSALDPGGAVALLGSFAKTLTPALGLGYLVVPEALRDSVARHALPVSGIVQEAMINFLEADGLRRHTARMRREYRKRREIFASIFPNGIPMDGGLHAVIELPGDAQYEAQTIARCQMRGLAVEGLSNYWSTSTRAGIVIGLGAHNQEKLRVVLLELKDIIAATGSA